MTEELIINGERVDTGGVDISLEYVNNILTSVDKISSSHSYTISLPRTTRNERILDVPTMVDHQSSKVGVYLPAEYRRNGISIVRNGKAYITGVKEAIDICLIWDNLAPYAAWVAAGKTIGDLGYTNPSWATTGSTWASRTNEVFLAYLQSGVDEDTVVCLNFWRMVAKIMNGIGVSWYLGAGTNAQGLAQNMAIPCLKFSGSWDAEPGSYSVNTRNKDFNLFHEGGTDFPITGDTRISVGKRKKISIEAQDFVLYGTFGSTGSVRFVGWKGGTTSPVTLATFGLSIAAARNSATFTAHTEVDVTEYQGYYVYFIIDGITEGSLTASSSRIYLRSYYDTATHGTEFHIETCAPAVKQTDVIKTFCALFGLALVTTPDGRLKFTPYSTLLQRGAWAIYDWTEKVVNFSGVPKIEFKVGSYGYKNTFEYLADEKDPVTGADGAIYSGSTTNGSEHEAVKLPFAASDDITIRYKTKDDSGTKKFVEVKPRIMGLYSYYKDSAARVQLKFRTEQKFDNIIPNRYGLLQQILEYPITITVYLRLNEFDLSSLEMDKPVYLGQTGRYYIIGKIKTDNSSDISEVELIQM